MASENETVAEVFAEADSVQVWDFPDGPMRYMRRMRSAHDREVAALTVTRDGLRRRLHECEESLEIQIANNGELCNRIVALKAKIQNLSNDCLSCDTRAWRPNAEQLTEIARTAAERDALKSEVATLKKTLKLVTEQMCAYCRKADGNRHPCLEGCETLKIAKAAGEEVAE